MKHNFEHQSQDSRQSLAEQIHEQFRRQMDAERHLEHEEARKQGSFSERR